MRKNRRNKTLYIFCGAPGSGKSTYARKIIKKALDEHKRWRYISRDKIRFQFIDESTYLGIKDYNERQDYYFSHEEEVVDTFYNAISESLLNADIDIVIADAAHLNTIARLNLLKRVQIPRSTKISFVYFDVPLKECLRRNKQRTGWAKVPEIQIRKFHRMLSKPEKIEVHVSGLENNETELIIVNKNGSEKICDLPIPHSCVII